MGEVMVTFSEALVSLEAFLFQFWPVVAVLLVVLFVALYRWTRGKVQKTGKSNK